MGVAVVRVAFPHVEDLESARGRGHWRLHVPCGQGTNDVEASTIERPASFVGNQVKNEGDLLAMERADVDVFQCTSDAGIHQALLCGETFPTAVTRDAGERAAAGQAGEKKRHGNGGSDGANGIRHLSS